MHSASKIFIRIVYPGVVTSVVSGDVMTLKFLKLNISKTAWARHGCGFYWGRTGSRICWVEWSPYRWHHV